MSELSNYIHKELQLLLKQVQNTPPRKHSSLAKIEALVKSAPLEQADKKQLQKEIKNVQSAIKAAHTPMKSNKNLEDRRTIYRTPNALMQFSQNSNILKTFLLDKISKPQKTNQKLVALQNQYEQLKIIRQSKERYLSELIIRVQKMERLQKGRARSEQSKREKAKLAQQYQQKQTNLHKIKEDALLAAKGLRKQIVHNLIQKYCDKIDEKSK